jgi:hypothetical protein
MKYLPVNCLPRFWWLRPWTTARRLQSHLIAVNELLNRNAQRAELYHLQADMMQTERDRAIVQANKWRFKYEDLNNNFRNQLLNEAIDEAFDDWTGDTDYLSK